MKNKQAFAECMSMMTELFSKEISEPLRALYWRILEPYTDEQCERAFKAVLMGHKFFPKPAEILEIINGTPEDRAQAAIEKVIWAVRHIGPYATVKFDDPKIHGAIEAMGGWAAFQDCTMDGWPWRQKDFLRFYALQGDREQPELLPGIIETSNRTRGYEKYVPPPERIGRIVTGNVGILDEPKNPGLKLIKGRASIEEQGHGEG